MSWKELLTSIIEIFKGFYSMYLSLKEMMDTTILFKFLGIMGSIGAGITAIVLIIKKLWKYRR